jgi:hypothetical protein
MPCTRNASALPTMIRWLSLAALVLCAAIVTATASPSQAQARGYTCIYRTVGVYAVIDGYDNGPSVCRMFNRPVNGARVRYAYGRTYCAWTSKHADLRVAIRTPRRPSFGRSFCSVVAASIPNSRRDWIRTR